eukprot:1116699-Rhodomonas_salina.1
MFASPEAESHDLVRHVRCPFPLASLRALSPPRLSSSSRPASLSLARSSSSSLPALSLSSLSPSLPPLFSLPPPPSGSLLSPSYRLSLLLPLPLTRSPAHMREQVADYVLVWTGGGGDDLAKSPHMARIGNSVYPGLCPGDPTCRMFGFMDRQ